MKIKSKTIKIVEIGSLVLNPKNNNKHGKEQIEKLADLIKYNGFRQPIIVSNRSGFVVSGHGRIESAKLAGLKEVPVMYQDFDNEAEEYSFMTSDNAIGKDEWASLDLMKVNEELFNLDLDIDMLGIKNFNVLPQVKFEMEDELQEDMNKKFVLEVTFPNDMEMADIRDDLMSRGYIVKER